MTERKEKGVYLELAGNIRPVRRVDERLMSYNIEMTEVTGGTFWKAYTPGQIAGTEEFLFSGELTDFTAAAGLMQYYPPINLYDEKLRALAKELGPAWIRVSGSWATKTYYDFDGETGGKAPEGYQSVLTKEQWIGVLDFVKAVDGKLLVSISNCAGDHPGGGPLDLAQAKKLFGFSRAYGVDIDAAEFMNEPNMLEMSGAPKGYTAADYARDQDIFFSWLRENYPDCLLVGPCSLGDAEIGRLDAKSAGAGIGSMMRMCSTDELLSGTKVPMDVFSYHYYNGISERLASMMLEGHWDGGEAHTDAYLAVAPENARTYAQLRDKHVPGGQMWVTESGDAGGGGNSWASTYLDVLRTLNELGSFAAITDGVIFHNTLASSDYGFLQHGSFAPRPNYFAVLLWNRLMGSTVYACENPGIEGAHVYCHSRKDGKEGVAYLIINNSLENASRVKLPRAADRYTLSAEAMRSGVMQLNGKDLALSGLAGIPPLDPVRQEAGIAELAPGSCTFLVM
ncbi:MAG: beta-glucuronidase [Clostridia bacterium]|nr:beta-glucuronidase [Clostridia bacterium]